VGQSNFGEVTKKETQYFQMGGWKQNVEKKKTLKSATKESDLD